MSDWNDVGIITHSRRIDVTDLFVRVLRKKASYQYKRNMKAKDDWLNNDNNNMLDQFLLFFEESRLFSAPCQSVANIPGGRFLDTIAPGAFKIHLFIGEGLFADPRNFYGRIHGIIDCFDMEGQYINDHSVEAVAGKNGAPEDFTRWLIHDTQKHKPEPPMNLTRVAWSAGCFVLHPSDLESIANILDAYKMNPGDIIDGELEEIA